MDSTRPSRSSWLSTSSVSWGRVRESESAERKRRRSARRCRPGPARSHRATWPRHPTAGAELGSRKMPQVAGNDDLGTGLDRRCQHVPVGWIRELKSFNEGLVPGDQAVPDRSVHRLPEAIELVRRDVRPVPAQGPEHLVEDLVGPLGLHQAGLADTDQQVPAAYWGRARWRRRPR